MLLAKGAKVPSPFRSATAVQTEPGLRFENVQSPDSRIRGKNKPCFPAGFSPTILPAISLRQVEIIVGGCGSLDSGSRQAWPEWPRGWGGDVTLLALCRLLTLQQRWIPGLSERWPIDVAIHRQREA